MATASTLLPLGTVLPSVVLTDVVDGSRVDVNARAKGARGTLLAFICNHCPYVVHIRSELVRVANEACERGFAVFAINSNDEKSHPQDGPSEMAALAKREAWRFPFLFDRSQDVARALGAECTPELYLFDAAQKLVYHGQFDDSRPSNGKPVTGADLQAAIDAVAAGQVPSTEQRTAIGCNIKWRQGA